MHCQYAVATAKTLHWVDLYRLQFWHTVFSLYAALALEQSHTEYGMFNKTFYTQQFCTQWLRWKKYITSSLEINSWIVLFHQLYRLLCDAMEQCCQCNQGLHRDVQKLTKHWDRLSATIIITWKHLSQTSSMFAAVCLHHISYTMQCFGMVYLP